VASIFCNQCGHENPPGSRFCSSCGATLHAHHEHQTEGLEPLTLDGEPGAESSAAASLVVASGHRAGTRFDISGNTASVGRHPESDVFLDDITVSRRHVELVESPTGYALRDVGSLNGTYVNGQRIEGEVPLTNGDELQVGKFKLLFLVSSAGA
jgi:pSer/pThr/pTyr-binding forkhead associated (FHA) protein